MATVKTTIVITHGTETVQTIKSRLLKSSTRAKPEARALSEMLRAISAGTRRGSLLVGVDAGTAVAASGTITLSSMVNNDTITVGGVVFTCKTSGATGNQFNVGVDDTHTATAIATVLNANIPGIVSATSALGVVTVTAAVKGTIGNAVGLAISAHGSVSAALLANGVDPAASTTYLFS